MGKRALASSLALLVATPGASAHASDLSWSGPAECSQREQLLFQIERALGASLAETAPFPFQVHVERTTPDVRARLVVQGDGDASSVKERLLVAPDCSQLVDTLAIAVALAIEAARSEVEARPAALASTRAAPEAEARSRQASADSVAV